VQAKWTNGILYEMLRALQKNRSDSTAEKAAALRDIINDSVRDCLVTGYRPLIDAPARVLQAALLRQRQTRARSSASGNSFVT
jgi:hypothetical protein